MLILMQQAKEAGLPEPVLLVVSGNRAPHLAGSQHDVDPTVLHSLTYADFWTAFEHRYGVNPDLVTTDIQIAKDLHSSSFAQCLRVVVWRRQIIG